MATVIEAILDADDVKAQVRRLNLESEKLEAEARKLMAEANRLAAEWLKMEGETRFQPWPLLAQGLIVGAALLAAGVTLAKLLTVN